jgi:hypothetical protein
MWTAGSTASFAAIVDTDSLQRRNSDRGVDVDIIAIGHVRRWKGCMYAETDRDEEENVDWPIRPIPIPPQPRKHGQRKISV